MVIPRSRTSRSPSPISPLASSLQLATSTIDELTLALVNFSRIPSPEPSPTALTCCCGNDECENLRTWRDVKNKLDTRLILSAEVGQALLQRHEAYVRRTEHANRALQIEDDKDDMSITDSQYNDMMDEREALKKKLDQAMVNNEIAEASHKAVLLELQEARDVISRLSTSNARSIGWESRLAALVQEKEDMQQERDSETQRAKVAEARINALKERTGACNHATCHTCDEHRAGKLQAEVRGLQQDLEQRRLNRLESSEHILHEARTHLRDLLHSQVGRSAEVERTELMNVLETLVQDNETLKREVEELQSLLSQSREEYDEVQRELEEQRALTSPRPHSSLRRGHVYSGSMVSLSAPPKEYGRKRHSSAERRPRYSGIEPLSPATTHRTPLPPSPMSAAESLPETPWSPTQSQSRYPISFSGCDDDESYQTDMSPEKTRKRKPLLLLTRSRGVQTDPPIPPPIPSPFNSSSPFGPRSESSSVSENQSQSSQTPMSTLVERISSLMTRMTQADALTLTNRLKRQHIHGADVTHISRTTISTILSEVSGLRALFRSLLEDETSVTTCTRRELRGLFKIFRDAFASMADMRITLNDIILDPSIAPQISKNALGLALDVKEDKSGMLGSSWIAPISKLFGPITGVDQPKGPNPNLSRANSSHYPTRPGPRAIPKLGPALSASTTMVNVEFSGSGMTRNVTKAEETLSNPSTPPPQVTEPDNSAKIMDIFAGAPVRSQDPWVVIPRGPRKTQSTVFGLQPETARSSLDENRLSRNVDAVLDDQRVTVQSSEPENSLLQRTLRRRGMSDSSMRSTFISHGEDIRDPPPNTPASPIAPASRAGLWTGQGASMFQTITKRVQTLRGMVDIRPQPNEQSPGTPPIIVTRKNSQPSSNPEPPSLEHFFVGSLRDEGGIRRSRPGRDFV